MIEYHDKDIIMNDVKLDNFVLSKNKIFCIDREHCYLTSDKRRLSIQKVYINIFGCSVLMDKKWEDKSKLAELILNLCGIRSEPFYLNYDHDKFIEYIQ
ncbi:hypothetical protein [Mycoplasma crocodyli]|uniref:hypothetical protein n=1 Tax=Mycoplasma crocodyli TaxID=50052 RepID=UPI0005A2B61B|nr:hypothetical protein [Mycoplasma crocodyli]